MQKATSIAVLAGSLILLTPAAAFADTGQSVKFADGSIVFYIGTSGNATGKNFAGGRTYKLCADGPGKALQMFYTHFVEVKNLAPDTTHRTVGASYVDPRKCSSSLSTSAKATAYHLDITWSNASGATPGRENGVTEKAAA